MGCCRCCGGSKKTVKPWEQPQSGGGSGGRSRGGSGASPRSPSSARAAKKKKRGCLRSICCCLCCCGGGNDTAGGLSKGGAYGDDEEIFTGPTGNRKCTDWVCFVLVVITWMVTTAIGLSAMGHIDTALIRKGDPARLLHGMDFRGNICGTGDSSKIEDLPRLYKPNYDKNTSIIGQENSKDGFVDDDFAICVKDCPTKRTMGPNCDKISNPYNTSEKWCSLETIKVLNFCIDPDKVRGADFAADALADIRTASAVIGSLGFFGSMVLSFVYLLLIRAPGMLALTVYGTVGVVLLILAGGAYYTLNRTEDLKDADDDKEQSAFSQDKTQIFLMELLGYTLLGLAWFWLCFICFMRQRIALAMGIIKASARALSRIPTIVTVPLLQTMGLILFLVVWIIFATYVASAGKIEAHEDKTTGRQYKTFSYDENTRNSMYLLLFVLLWTTEFITCMGELVTAYCISVWFFTRDKAVLGPGVVLRAILVNLRYHVGTAAFASLLLTIIKPTRGVMAYVYRKCETCRICLCCFHCFITGLERCIALVNRSAFVQTAIFSCSFVAGGIRAFDIFNVNIVRTSALTVVADFVLFVGKVAITFIIAGYAYYYMATYMAEELSGFFIPTATTAILAYLTANMFCSVVNEACDTILQCFFVDEEYFAADESFAEPELQRYLDDCGALRDDEGSLESPGAGPV